MSEEEHVPKIIEINKMTLTKPFKETRMDIHVRMKCNDCKSDNIAILASFIPFEEMEL